MKRYIKSLIVALLVLMHATQITSIDSLRNDPYVLDKGFNTIVSSETGLTIHDIITNSDAFKQHKRPELAGAPLMITMIQSPHDPTEFAPVGLPLYWLALSEQELDECINQI